MKARKKATRRAALRRPRRRRRRRQRRWRGVRGRHRPVGGHPAAACRSDGWRSATSTPTRWRSRRPGGGQPRHHPRQQCHPPEALVRLPDDPDPPDEDAEGRRQGRRCQRGRRGAGRGRGAGRRRRSRRRRGTARGRQGQRRRGLCSHEPLPAGGHAACRDLHDLHRGRGVRGRELPAPAPQPHARPELPDATVRTEVNGYAPQEVESQISRPIEEQLATTEGIVSWRAAWAAPTWSWSSPAPTWTTPPSRSGTHPDHPAPPGRPSPADPALRPQPDPSASRCPSTGRHGRAPGRRRALRPARRSRVKREIEATDGIAAVRVRGLEREILVEAREDPLAARGSPSSSSSRRWAPRT